MMLIMLVAVLFVVFNSGILKGFGSSPETWTYQQLLVKIDNEPQNAGKVDSLPKMN